MISLLLQGPLTALLMQQTWSSSQEEEIIRHTRQVNANSNVPQTKKTFHLLQYNNTSSIAVQENWDQQWL